METRVSRISKAGVVWLLLAPALWLVTTGVAASALGQTADAPVKIAVLDPRGIRPPIQRIPLSPRPQNMSRSTVHLLDTKDGVGLIYGPLKAEFEKRYPGVNVVITDSSWGIDDAFIEKTAAQADAFVFGGSGGSSGSQGAAYSAVKLEKSGVPGVHIACEDMKQVAEWKARSTGVPIRIASTPCPKDRITGKQMAGIVDGVIDALTRDLTREERRNDIIKPDPPGQVAIKGTISEIQDYFHKQHWTDGLPVVPPTREAVEEMLTGTSHSRDEVIAESWGCEGWGATVEAVAINAVMAGAKPEYMPVLLATVEAADLIRGRSAIGGRFPTVVVSTNGFGFMQVINGPYAKEIGMNSGRGALGPGYRPNATIGRALQLFIRNLGGCVSGISMNPTMGNNTLHAGVCFAEAEDASPWEPLHVGKPMAPVGPDGKAVMGAEADPGGGREAIARAKATGERVGYRVSDTPVPSFGSFKADDSVLTFMVLWNAQVGNYWGTGLDRAKELARTMVYFEFPSGLVALISPDAAVYLAEEEGMSKNDFIDFLYKNATRQIGDLRENSGFWYLVEPTHPGYADLPDDAVVPVYPRQFIRVIVVGAQDQVPHIHGWTAAFDIQVSIDKWR
jgi:hypothetical protein